MAGVSKMLFFDFVFAIGAGGSGGGAMVVGPSNMLLRLLGAEQEGGTGRESRGLEDEDVEATFR